MKKLYIAFKLPRIFPGAPLTVNGAPGNSQGNLTGMVIWKPKQNKTKQNRLHIVLDAIYIHKVDC